MRLNTLSPAEGSTKAAKRRGRGIGSGLGKTCGRGHKGQKARSGGYHRVGFEGGQMPLHRRLPKFGFTSRKSLVSKEVRTSELAKLKEDIISVDSLKNSGLITKNMRYVKIMLSGDVTRAFTVKAEISLTAGARKAIESAGGKVEA